MSKEKVPKITPKSSETVLKAGRTAHQAVPEISSLPENARDKLINAVWYQCENPNCRYTQFLHVHHIISEVEGGSNRLDNLIVLCSRCHTAARNQEISTKELQSWLRDRSQRFKSDLDWPYK